MEVSCWLKLGYWVLFEEQEECKLKMVINLFNPKITNPFTRLLSKTTGSFLNQTAHQFVFFCIETFFRLPSV